MKPYFERGGVTLWNADCRDVLPTLAVGSVDLVLTDPPYGINHTTHFGASWQDTEIVGDDSTELRDYVIGRFTGLPMFIFGSWKVGRPAGTRAVLVWDKGPAFGMGDLSFPWKPSFEEIYVLGDGFSGKRDEGVIKGHIVVSWESKGRRHPHEKPVSLMKYLMAKTEARTVIDPFCGTGPVLRAAKDLGRRAVGVEIDERYCEVAAKRLEQEVLPCMVEGA